MLDDTVQKDQLASQAHSTVQELINDAIPIAEAAIIASAPFLATPFIRPIWEFFFKLLVQKISEALGVGASFIVMDIQKYTQVTSAASAIDALKDAQISGDQNAIDQARLAADAAAASLLRYNGDAHSE